MIIRTVSYSGFLSLTGWQHVCFTWGNGGNWQLFFNGVAEKSGYQSLAVGQVQYTRCKTISISAIENFFSAVSIASYKHERLLGKFYTVMLTWDQCLERGSWSLIPAHFSVQSRISNFRHPYPESRFLSQYRIPSYQGFSDSRFPSSVWIPYPVKKFYVFQNPALCSG